MTTIIKQTTSEESSSAKYPVGEEMVDEHATLGRRVFVYLQADGDMAAGDAAVCDDGKKAKVCAAETMHLPPVVPLIAVTDAYYAWFQKEGEIASCRAMISSSLGTNIGIGYELCLYPATNIMVPMSSLVEGLFKGWMVAKAAHPYQATSYTCSTINVYLRGVRGAPKLESSRDEPLAQDVTTASTTQKQVVGAIYEDDNPALGHRKFIYLQADGDMALGDACVTDDGRKAKAPQAETMHLPPIVPLVAVAGDSYGWFQTEGEVANCRAMISSSLGVNIDTGYELQMYPYTGLFVHASTLLGQGWEGWAIAAENHPYDATSYTCATLSVYLRGVTGAPRSRRVDKALRQAVTASSASATHNVGETREDDDPDLGHRKFVYLQADGDVALGGACVSDDGLKAKAPASDTIHLPPLVPLVAISDTEYGWFQIEGEVANCRAMISTSIGANIDTGYELMLYPYTNLLCHASSLLGELFQGFAVAKDNHPYDATSYTCATLNVYLRGVKGAALPLHGNRVLRQALTSSSATALHVIGEIYEYADPTDGIKKFIYLEADGAVAAGGVRVAAEGQKAHEAGANTRHLMPHVAMAAIGDGEFGWFQFEGVCDNVRAMTSTSMGDSINTSDQLCLYAGTDVVMHPSTGSANIIGWMVALESHPYEGTSYTCSTLSVYLRGVRGAPFALA